MNAISTDQPTVPAIVWPSPTINSVPPALDAASCLIERLGALFHSNNADLHEAFIETAGLTDWQEQRAYSIWMIYELASEKLSEIDTLIAAINSAVHAGAAEPATPVGKHVELRQRTDWSEAVRAYREAEAAPTTDVTIAAAADAYERMLATRAPNLRCLHEKMTFVNSVGWGSDTAIESVFADVEHLARKFEIARAADLVAENRGVFEKAVVAFHDAEKRLSGHPLGKTKPSDPSYPAVSADHGRAVARYHAEFAEVATAQAPDYAAVLDKLDVIAKYAEDDEALASAISSAAADIRRLGGEG